MTAYQQLQTGPITIGEGCWIGQNVIVLPDVNIGDKCVIGANSVVTKDIPSYSIAVGMPAKVIKKYNFELHRWVKV
jgi:lipopolysaccharide O-acetyltransferase